MDAPLTREQLRSKTKKETKIVPLKSGGAINVELKSALWGINLRKSLSEIVGLAVEDGGKANVSSETIVAQFELMTKVLVDCVLTPDGDRMYESETDSLLIDLDTKGITEQFSAVLDAMGMSRFIDDEAAEKK